MPNTEIAEMIFKDKRYLSICKRIAKKPLMAEELHSEFILSVLETKDDRLTIAQKGGYLEVFCVGMINNIWRNRYRVKNREKGNTSNLHEICNYANTLEIEPEAPQEYCDEDIDLIKKAHQILENERNSDNQIDRFRASVFYHSTITFKNTKRFHTNSGIPYQTVVIPNYKLFKSKIKKMLECYMS